MQSLAGPGAPKSDKERLERLRGRDVMALSEDGQLIALVDKTRRITILGQVQSIA
jgi:hypothetical protein